MMNWKRQAVVCALVVWLLFAYTVAVRWVVLACAECEAQTVWGWRSAEWMAKLGYRSPSLRRWSGSSLQRLLTLAAPGLVLSIALWFVLGDKKAP